MCHYQPLPTGGTQKLVVNATIRSKSNDTLSITTLLPVDGGCEVAELVLLPNDIRSLGLAPTGDVGHGLLADGGTAIFVEHGRVLLTLTFDDGSVVEASMFPMTIQPSLASASSETASSPIHGVAADIDTQRILGYGGLTRLSLKQDYKHHKLVKVVRRA